MWLGLFYLKREPVPYQRHQVTLFSSCSTEFSRGNSYFRMGIFELFAPDHSRREAHGFRREERGTIRLETSCEMNVSEQGKWRVDLIGLDRRKTNVAKFEASSITFPLVSSLLVVIMFLVWHLCRLFKTPTSSCHAQRLRNKTIGRSDFGSHNS